MTWRKSSYSGSSIEEDCVEVAITDVAVGVRDSKNVTGPALGFDPQAWRAFVAAL